MDQQGYFHYEDLHLRGTNIHQPNFHPMVTASENYFVLSPIGSRGGVRFRHRPPLPTRFRHPHPLPSSFRHPPPPRPPPPLPVRFRHLQHPLPPLSARIIHPHPPPLPARFRHPHPLPSRFHPPPPPLPPLPVRFRHLQHPSPLPARVLHPHPPPLPATSHVVPTYPFHPPTIIPRSNIYPTVTTSWNHFILDDHLILNPVGSRGGLWFHCPPLPVASHGAPTYHLHRATIRMHNDFGESYRHFDSTLSTSPPFHRRMSESTFRNQNFDLTGFTIVDDSSGSTSNNIDDMSYEELFALGERIGNEATSLLDEMIVSQMVTKAASVDHETESCVICQEEYKKGEKIGILRCKHEFHAHCLRKWLREKNVCPMCRCEALTLGKSL